MLVLLEIYVLEIVSKELGNFAPFFHGPLDNQNRVRNGRKALANGHGKQAATPDSLDMMLGPNLDADNED